MARYSEEFKLMIVEEYQKGKLRYKLLAKKYDLKSTSPIKQWLNTLEIMGKKG